LPSPPNVAAEPAVSGAGAGLGGRVRTAGPAGGRAAAAGGRGGARVVVGAGRAADAHERLAVDRGAGPGAAAGLARALARASADREPGGALVGADRRARAGHR